MALWIARDNTTTGMSYTLFRRKPELSRQGRSPFWQCGDSKRRHELSDIMAFALMGRHINRGECFELVTGTIELAVVT